MNTSLDHQLTGNVGLYYCCYKLSLLGWNVMPTARNARGVDIIAYSRDASRFVGIQVKAPSRRNPVPLGTSLEKCMGDFWVIINRSPRHLPHMCSLRQRSKLWHTRATRKAACRIGSSHPHTTGIHFAKPGDGSVMAATTSPNQNSWPSNRKLT